MRSSAVSRCAVSTIGSITACVVTATLVLSFIGMVRPEPTKIHSGKLPASHMGLPAWTLAASLDCRVLSLDSASVSSKSLAILLINFRGVRIAYISGGLALQKLGWKSEMGN
jgi:hypothetical protein